MGYVKRFNIGNGQTALYYVDESLSSADYPPSAKAVGDALVVKKNEIDALENRIHYTTANLYDPSLQTPSTISPHYYYNGVPYSSTQFDSSYNCTAEFEIEPDTTYTIGLVPSIGNTGLPWDRATSGLFFYDSSHAYISTTSDGTFTTPSNAKYARFNYSIASGINLTVLNERCMLVKGGTLPSSYVGYQNEWIMDRMETLESQVSSITPDKPINYIIDTDGNGITLISKYNSTHDIAVHMAKKGGNLLFDFDSIGLIPNQLDQVSTSTDGIQYLLQNTGDWFAPFKMSADANGDGDNPTSEYYTGGNHQYNNGASGSTPTARTSALAFYADKKTVSSGSGSAREVEMVWTNYVQGYNTTKANGTGREILKEVHRVTFDGTSFTVYVDLIPLEALTISTWYGFQWFTAPYNNTRFIGGENRAEVDVAVANETSGNHDCCNVTGYNGGNEISISIDYNYDLGKREYYTGNDSVITRYAYNKGYFNIISHLEAASGDIYSLKGKYTFSAHH